MLRLNMELFEGKGGRGHQLAAARITPSFPTEFPGRQAFRRFVAQHFKTGFDLVLRVDPYSC